MNNLKKYMLVLFALLLSITGAYADSAKQVDFLLSGYDDPTSHRPLSGGMVWTYLDGTSTLAPVWTDKDKGGVATNPVELDSAGKAEIYGDGIYKFRIYDSGGSFIQEITGLEYVTTVAASVALQAKVTKIDTIADLRAHTGYTGESVQVLGYYTPGDGGGGPVRVFKSGAAPGFYANNGGSSIWPDGGDGSSSWVFEWSGPVSVKWFGAKGDGSTDDSISIQACIYASEKVYFPVGVYMCVNIAIDSGTNISGQSLGAYLKTIPTAVINDNLLRIGDNNDLLTTENITISGITLDGNKDNTVGDKNAGISLIGLSGTDTRNINIEGCVLKDNNYIGVRIRGGATNVLVQGNVFNDTDAAVWIGGVSSKDVRVIGNKMATGFSEGVMTDGSVATHDGLVVSGNIISDKVGGIVLTDTVTNFSITGNVISDIVGVGIKTSSLCSNGSIVGNSIKDIDFTGINIDGDRITLSGNTVSTTGQGSISGSVSITNSSIVGNTCIDPNGNNDGQDGIRIFEGSKVLVSGNNVQDNRSVKLMENGIRVRGGSTDVTISGNSISGAVNAGVHAGGTTGTRLLNNDVVESGKVMFTPDAGVVINDGTTSDVSPIVPLNSSSLFIFSSRYVSLIAGTSGSLTNLYVDSSFAGYKIAVNFQTAATINHGTGNIYLQGAVSRAAIINEVIEFVWDGVKWVEI